METGTPLRIAAFSFTPRLVPTLAALAMVALTVSLGRWQAHRAAEKAQQQAILEARAQEPIVDLAVPGISAQTLVYRRVSARGAFVPEGQIFVDNRIREGRAGYHVVTPLRIAGSSAVVLVNRGWIARSSTYPEPPEVAVPQGEVAIDGLATLPPARVLELSEQTVAGKVWQNLSLARYSERMHVAVLPVVLLASPPGTGLAAVHERPDTGVDKHREYSLTWFALAATVTVLWLALNLRRIPRG
jgi:surfeit locus 1 family protein